MPSRYTASTVQLSQPKEVRTSIVTLVTSVARTPGFDSPQTTIHSLPRRTTTAPARAKRGDWLSVTHVLVMVW